MKTDRPKNVFIGAFVSAELKERLTAVAEQREIGLAAAIRKLIETGLAHYTNELPPLRPAPAEAPAIAAE